MATGLSTLVSCLVKTRKLLHSATAKNVLRVSTSTSMGSSGISSDPTLYLGENCHAEQAHCNCRWVIRPRCIGRLGHHGRPCRSAAARHRTQHLLSGGED